jgi:hypothetical protein
LVKVTAAQDFLPLIFVINQAHMGPITSSRFDFELKFADFLNLKFDLPLYSMYSSKSKQNVKLGEFLALNLLGLR